MPRRLTFTLAATAALFKEGRIDGRQFQGRRQQGDFVVEDDPRALVFWQAAWQRYRGTPASAWEVATYILGNSALWSRDLNAVPGLTEKLGV
ncbi:MAG: tagaturonate reductase, partial [Firmicutes bacterium]|nr:tagaturonate reductase [Bacillota bacterium]